MAKGKKWNKEEVLEVLEEYFRLGMSVRKACAAAGIPDSTVATWVTQDKVIRAKIKSWQSTISTQARRNIFNSIEEGEIGSSWDWLKTKEKDEFSTRQEVKAENTNYNTELTHEELEAIRALEEESRSKEEESRD